MGIPASAATSAKLSRSRTLYRLIKKSHLPFSTEEVTRKGRNPKDTYQLMLEQIPLITSSSASGIVEQYPSFHSLMEGMERMERREAKGRCSRAEVETFLKDCPVGGGVPRE